MTGRTLTITLRLTLEPDLRLQFPSAAAHEAWGTGLKLLLRLLGNPDGLDTTQYVCNQLLPTLSCGCSI